MSSARLNYISQNSLPFMFPLRVDHRDSLLAQLIENQPAIQETSVRFLGWEDPLEKGEATHVSVLGHPWWLSW